MNNTTNHNITVTRISQQQQNPPKRFGPSFSANGRTIGETSCSIVVTIPTKADDTAADAKQSLSSQQLLHRIPSNKSEVDFAFGNSWTLYFWDDNNWSDIVEICKTNSIKSFWRWMNNIPSPGSASFALNYAFFKEDIPPLWENSNNKKGGKWMWSYRIYENEIADVDWVHLMLRVVGQTVGSGLSDEIIGITIASRAGGCRMSLWTRNSIVHNDDAVFSIGSEIKKILRLPDGSMTFKKHESSSKMNSSYNADYVLKI